MSTQLPIPNLPPARYPAPALKALPLRERPAQRVLADSEDCTLLELLATLTGGERQIETATAILKHFGTLRTIGQASLVELVNVPGVGEATAARIKAAFEFGRRLLAPETDRPVPIKSPADAAALFWPYLNGRDQEYLYVLLLNTRNVPIGRPIEIYHGSLNTSLIRVGELFKDAIKVNAAALIMAHGHPSGLPDPSPEDVAVSRAVVEAGKLLDIDVVDHLILGTHPRFVSLKERGLVFSA